VMCPEKIPTIARQCHSSNPDTHPHPWNQSRSNSQTTMRASKNALKDLEEQGIMDMNRRWARQQHRSRMQWSGRCRALPIAQHEALHPPSPPFDSTAPSPNSLSPSLLMAPALVAQPRARRPWTARPGAHGGGAGWRSAVS
jgi:hypothetical protein